MVDIKKIISTVVSFSLCMCLAAETFRVGKMHTVEISQDNNLEASAKIGINEAIAILFLNKEILLKDWKLKWTFQTLLQNGWTVLPAQYMTK